MCLSSWIKFHLKKLKLEPSFQSVSPHLIIIYLLPNFKLLYVNTLECVLETLILPRVLTLAVETVF